MWAIGEWLVAPVTLHELDKGGTQVHHHHNSASTLVQSTQRQNESDLKWIMVHHRQRYAA